VPSFAEGFLTGFMRDQTEVIRKRKDDAETYFNNQMELARTRGLKNRDLTKKVIDGNLQIARQLEQVGVPKDLIMATAKQNPDDLPNVLKQIQDMQMDGITPDEDFYRHLFQVSSDYKAPDEDMSTFMTNLYAPLKSNMKANPEGGSDNIFATMFGSNSMDRARNQLDTTEVADGMSAGDLLRYDGEPTPDTTGAPSVVLNAGMIGDETRAAKERLRDDDVITTTEINTVNSTYEKAIADVKLAIKEQILSANPDSNLSDSEIPNFQENAERVAAEKMLELFPRETLIQIPRIGVWLQNQEEEEADTSTIAGSTLPPAAVEPPAAQVPVPVEPALTPIPDGIPPKLADGSTYHDMASDGTIVYKGPNGEYFRIKPEALGVSKPDPSLNIDEILRNPTGN
jgi:hypothetical protein